MAAQIAILAGGQSRRMGTDKSFVRLNEKPLLQHVIERVSALQLPLVLIANDPAKYADFGLPVITDVLPNAGSLGGIYTAVQHGDAEYTLCVACDMPFLNPMLLDHMISVSTGYDAVVPIIGEHPQGLHAIYRKTCLAPMLKEVENNHLKIRDFYMLVNTHRIGETSLRQYDQQLKSFVNVNTPEALEAVKLDNALNN